MSNQQQDFSDTVQIQAQGTGDSAAVASDGAAQTDVDLWPEAVDFQCSQTASLFATSQNGTLNVV